GEKTQVLPLAEVHNAKTEQDSSSTYLTKILTRPILVRNDGTILPLSNIYESGTGAKGLVLSINTWLKPRKG
ncbi:MAG: hypothetical protein L0H65_03185, partial [Pseudorhodobacter sp.]|nr:hypothetical protein [Pseudorhodobacter sp.]